MAKMQTTLLTIKVHHDSNKLPAEKLKDLIASRVHTMDGVENQKTNPNTDGASVDVQIVMTAKDQ